MVELPLELGVCTHVQMHTRIKIQRGAYGTGTETQGGDSQTHAPGRVRNRSGDILARWRGSGYALMYGPGAMIRSTTGTRGAVDYDASPI
jgi:hypothetical protein